MAIRAVVFDIGGVLEHTPSTGWRDKWRDKLSGVGQELEARGLDSMLGTCTEKEWLAALQEISGLDDAQLDELMDDFWTEYLGTLNVELADFFAGLRPRYQTAMLSNSSLGSRAREQARYQFDQITDLIVYSHEVGMAKPDLRIYELTCQRLGVSPGEVIFLDDVEENVAAARDCGMHAVLFKDTQQAITEICALLGAPRAE